MCTKVYLSGCSQALTTPVKARLLAAEEPGKHQKVPFQSPAHEAGVSIGLVRVCLRGESLISFGSFNGHLATVWPTLFTESISDRKFLYYQLRNHHHQGPNAYVYIHIWHFLIGVLTQMGLHGVFKDSGPLWAPLSP